MLVAEECEDVSLQRVDSVPGSKGNSSVLWDLVVVEEDQEEEHW